MFLASKLKIFTIKLFDKLYLAYLAKIRIVQNEIALRLTPSSARFFSNSFCFAYSSAIRPSIVTRDSLVKGLKMGRSSALSILTSPRVTLSFQLSLQFYTIISLFSHFVSLPIFYTFFSFAANHLNCNTFSFHNVWSPKLKNNFTQQIKIKLTFLITLSIKS